MAFLEKLFGGGNKKGREEFSQAVKENNLARAKTLAEADRGVVNGKDFLGSTALHWAVHNKSEEAVRVVTGLGGKVNAPDAMGRRPLHWAVGEKSVEMTELLLTLGADVNATDQMGATALSLYLVSAGVDKLLDPNDKIVQLLKRSGG
jgi:ankyrin repeat protein